MDGEYILFALGAVMAPEAAPVMVEAVDRVATASRLQEVKARVDPDWVFLSNHQITLP
jgi:FAD/FMN-containing dehydrogenase